MVGFGWLATCEGTSTHGLARKRTLRSEINIARSDVHGRKLDTMAKAREHERICSASTFQGDLDVEFPFAFIAFFGSQRGAQKTAENKEH